MLPTEELNGENQISYEASDQYPKRSRPTKLFLPPEVIAEIISRLPVKSLLKFRSVSKSWLALISSPEFVKSHTSLSFNKNINDRVMEESNLDYLMKNSGMSFLIEGSVNGLLCLVNEVDKIFLWNPAIRKYKKLRNFRYQFRNASHFIYGFGYYKIHDDYKVVRTFTIFGRQGNFQQVNMYSLKNDSWQIIESPWNCNMGQLIISSKFVNGKLHWATIVGSGLERVWGITYFDLADEKWRKVERPCGDGFLVLGVLGTNLSMICNNPTNHMDVWSMKEYEDKQSRMKMFTINYSILHPMECLLYQSFYMSKKGEFLLMFKTAYMIYHPKDNSIRYSQLRKLNYGVLADFNIQSLVCPLSQNEPRT